MRTTKQQDKIYKVINARLLLNHELVEDSYLWFQDGKIIDGCSSFFDQLREPDEVIDAEGAIVAPGFIDVQINGSYGIDFADHDGSVEDLGLNIDKVARGLLRNGCTAFCPTVVSSAPEIYAKVLPLLGARPGRGAAAEILGAHVEGPFISQEKKGAHDQAIFRTGDIRAFNEAYGEEALKNVIQIITVAPELPGVLDAIPELARLGITISIGHSAASIDEAQAGVRRGATFITHLFNAMKPFHHRDPAMIGLLGATTELPIPSTPHKHPEPSCTSPHKDQPDPRPFYGIICDGVHVHPNSVRIAYYSHPKGCVLVTDALSAAGLPQGVYRLGSQDVEVRETGAAYVNGTHTLAGSTVTIDACVRNFRKFTRCSVVEALEAATLHPAQMLDIEHRKGTLKPGADADLVFLNDNLEVQKIFVRGQQVI